MGAYPISLIVLSGPINAVLLVKAWRRDFFFAMFFTMVIVYSAISQIGYLFFPELSIVMVRMYFGPEALPGAVIFSTLSLLALYAGLNTIYRPLVRRIDVPVRRGRMSPLTYLTITLVHVALLFLGFLYFRENLNYSNAADSDFLNEIGLPYKLFWNLFKFTTFTLIVLYGFVRSGLLNKRIGSGPMLAILVAKACIFFMIASVTGDRTDPLAVVLGILGYEYFVQRTAHGAVGAKDASPHGKGRSGRGGTQKSWLAAHWKFLVTSGMLLGVVISLLTLLENSRGGATTDDSLETSTLTQALLLKDYYTPFHVLIGAMANDFVSPFTVLLSNSANALMFLKVDYLQYFVVELWDPGSVTRAASPAFFAFTEGYMFLGWLGFIYNGVVWALGITLWRALSRTRDARFNAVAFAVVVSMAAVTARSQSSYFIKTLYLSYAPALALYAIASGTYPRYVAAIAGLMRRNGTRRSPLVAS